MKLCLKCNQEKEKFEFGKDNQKKDKLNQYCKECIKQRSSEQRSEHPGYYKFYAKKYREKNSEILNKISKERRDKDSEKYNKISRESYERHKVEISKRRKRKSHTLEFRIKERERQKVWRDKNPEKYRSYIKKWQQSNRIKHNAHQRVHRAIEDGYLIRCKTCEECGKMCKTEGHHEDYKKPLQVIWLCRLCHAKKIETVEV